MLAILDYGAGNLTSVARACAHLGIPAKITDNSSEIRAADGIIFPGVGAAGQAMRQLTCSGLDRELRRAASEEQPILGICLGCQILLDFSEEDQTQCLGILPGYAARFPKNLLDGQKPIKIPHMGWNSIASPKPCPILSNIPQDAEFYFVHGYYAKPPAELVLAYTEYGLQFCSVYGRDNLWALQFHPEKSGRWGLKILENFNNWCLEK